MICKITCLKCKLSDNDSKIVDRYLEKITRFLSGYAPDLPLLSIVIKKHNVLKKPSKNADFLKRSGIQEYFEGEIILHLPKTPLVGHSNGKTIDEFLNLGFVQLLRQIERFQSLNFTSHSKYPDKTSIRSFEY